jgi:micrococcal nuclease
VLRLVLILAAIGAAVLVLRAAGVLLVVAAIGLVVLAYWRPEQAAKVSGSRAAQRLPLWTRATPMRFGIFMVAFLIPATAVANGIGPAPAGSSASPSPSFVGSLASSTPDATSIATSEATPPATPRPTPDPTPAPTPVFGREPTGLTERATVTRVIDGDTIEVSLDGELYKVRYIGIDTPETHNGLEWMGPEASRANARLVADRKVFLEKDVSETDRYGRLLRYVWLKDGGDWLLVNAELLRMGFAQVSTYPPDVKYVDELYLAAERRARNQERGIWGPTPTPTPTPEPTPPPAATAPPSNCHSSYQGACLMIGQGDYDCAGGSGDGPNYTGFVYVVGYDEFDLDRDGDGLGCESS